MTGKSFKNISQNDKPEDVLAWIKREIKRHTGKLYISHLLIHTKRKEKPPVTNLFFKTTVLVHVFISSVSSRFYKPKQVIEFSK